MLNGLSESQDEGLWFLLGLEGGARISVTSGQHFRGLDILLLPKERIFGPCYDLLSCGVKREGIGVRLESCQRLNIKAGVRLFIII